MISTYGSLIIFIESAYLLCSSDFRVGFRLAEDKLFDQPVEEFADMFRPPAIETKCIFVEIPLKVFARHSALVCRPQPAFDERGDQVNTREVLERTFRISQDRRDPMKVSGFLHAVVSVPIVRMHFGSFADTIRYEAHQNHWRVTCWTWLLPHADMYE